MNKFEFISDIQVSTVKDSSCEFCKDYNRQFCFKFTSGNYPFSDVVRQRNEYEDHIDIHLSDSVHYGYGGLTVSMVDKSDIRQSVTKQLKEMILIVRSKNEFLYLKMSKATKDKFRMYYSYEVSYPPKILSDEDKEVGKIVGSIMGLKIIQDDSLGQDIVQPVVRVDTIKSKFDRVFEHEKTIPRLILTGGTFNEQNYC
jgi:hypothetical protein